MKIVCTVAVALAVFCYSCQEKKDYYSTKNLPLDSLKAKAMATSVRNDTIFLGFRFGMTTDEVFIHLKKLEKEKVIYQEGSQYKYNFELGEKSIYKETLATFGTEFYEGMLFKLVVSVEPSTTYGPHTAMLLTAEIKDIYDAKYGMYDYSSPFMDFFDFVWIDGNRMIRMFPGLSDCRITYLDIGVEKKVEERKKAKLDSAAKMTKRAI